MMVSLHYCHPNVEPALDEEPNQADLTSDPKTLRDSERLLFSGKANAEDKRRRNMTSEGIMSTRSLLVD